MTYNISRRTFVAASLGGAAAAALNPLGLFSSRSAFGTIPSGPYMQRFDSQRFWFSKMYDIPILSDENRELMKSEDGQLSSRLGESGGFAIGYFSTLGFLADYKSQEPESYRDLLVNSARLPDNELRPALILEELRRHRLTADLSGATKPLNARPNPAPIDHIAANRLDGNIPEAGMQERVPPEQPLRMTRPLESLDSPKISKMIGQAHADAPTRLRFDAFTNIKDIDAEYPSWPELQQPAQTLLSQQFNAVNGGFEDRFQALETTKLVEFRNGELKLDWIKHGILVLKFQDGVDHGRLAALAYVAMLEAGSRLKDNADQTATTAPSVAKLETQLINFREADDLLDCFGGEAFLRYGLDSGAFRPAVRLKSVCLVKLADGGVRRIELMTPFLPFEPGNNRPDEETFLAQRQGHDSMARTLQEQFRQPHLCRDTLPMTTVALEDGAFVGCPEMFRHTKRLVQEATMTQPGLPASSVESVVMVPEVTSPWTFAGVGSALCNTYLFELSQLKTQEERIKFRRSVYRSVDELLVRSVAGDDHQSISNSSATSPAMVQYASGYRAAYTLSDRMTDELARTDGAYKVYENLRKALPEHFKSDLPKDQLLTADIIASYVSVVANAIAKEINDLRVTINQLKGQLDQYAKFVSELKTMIDQLSNDLQAVHNVEDLKRFQQQGAALITAKIQSAATESQSAALVSLQGLLSTMVTVGVSVEANVKAEARGNVQICSVGIQK